MRILLLRHIRGRRPQQASCRPSLALRREYQSMTLSVDRISQTYTGSQKETEIHWDRGDTTIEMYVTPF